MRQTYDKKREGSSNKLRPPLLLDMLEVLTALHNLFLRLLCNMNSKESGLQLAVRIMNKDANGSSWQPP